MLTVEQLDTMPPGTIFATGTAMDRPDGLYLSNSREELRWVAVRGNIHDWTIYAHLAEHNAEWVKHHGDKVFSEEHIRKLVPCNKAAFSLYRF